MAGIVTFELVARARAVQRFQRVADILEGVAEDEVVGALQHLRLPVVLERLVPLQHREQAEIHRPHVEARDLRLPGGGRPHALLDGHVGRSAGRQVHDDVGALLDDAQERLKGLRRLIRPSIDRIARVEMNDRGPRRRGAEGGLGNLGRCHRQMRRHRGRVDRSGNRAGNDDLVRRHDPSLSLQFRCVTDGNRQVTNLWKFGSRFSLNAVTPSFDSAVS